MHPRRGYPRSWCQKGAQIIAEAKGTQWLALGDLTLESEQGQFRGCLSVMRQQLWCDSRQAEREGLDRICSPGLLGHEEDTLVWKTGCFYFVSRKAAL